MHPFMREMTGRSVAPDACNGLSRHGRPSPGRQGGHPPPTGEGKEAKTRRSSTLFVIGAAHRFFGMTAGAATVMMTELNVLPAGWA